MDAHDKIFNLLFDKDEVTWQSVLYELVRSEEMDPWDIDIGLLTKRFILKINELKEMDFRLSGKVVLAAATLLKIKSTRLVGADIDYFDSLIAQKEGSDEDLLFEEDSKNNDYALDHQPSLIPRTPQPRKRKVSIFDLVKALEVALEVKRRRVLQNIPPRQIEIPIKHTDITQLIKNVYGKIRSFFVTHVGSTLSFSKLLPSKEKDDKIFTFIPLLHLANTQKIELHQETPFGEIDIRIRKKEEFENEGENSEE